MGHHRHNSETTDGTYVSQQEYIINVTRYEQGFLIMDFSERMKAALYPWYFDMKKQGKITQHEVIPNEYTNNHMVRMDKLNLDLYPEVRHKVASELRQILQWWTRMPLRHTSTFGLRVYRRDAMLIDHLDRA